MMEHWDGTTAVLVADVSAKGVEGTTFAYGLSALFKVVSAFVESPARILENLNRFMYDAFADPSRGLFASAFVCRCFPAHRQCLYASAGAETPILLTPRRPPRLLEGNGMVLGVKQHIVHSDYGLNVDCDDVLVLYTDGVVDARRDGTTERVGTNGLLEDLCNAATAEPQANASRALAAIEKRGCRYSDDASLLMVSFT